MLRVPDVTRLYTELLEHPKVDHMVFPRTYYYTSSPDGRSIWAEELSSPDQGESYCPF